MPGFKQNFCSASLLYATLAIALSTRPVFLWANPIPVPPDTLQLLSLPHYYSSIGTSASGMGGVFLFSNDATAIYLNPARATLKKPTLTVEGSRFGASNWPSGIRVQETRLLPQFIGIVLPVRNLTVGLARTTVSKVDLARFIAYIPEEDPPWGWIGANLNELGVSLAYVVFPELSLGIAVSYLYGSYVEKTYNGGLILDQGNGKGYGLRLGVSYSLTQTTTFCGRVRLKSAIEGTTSHERKLKGEIPFSTAIGLAYNSDRISVYYQLDYANWKALYSTWENRIQSHFGIEFRMNHAGVVRAGFYTKLLPHTDKNYLGLNDLYFFTTGISIDFDPISFHLSIEETEPMSEGNIQQAIWGAGVGIRLR